jgi:hypothetical protein
MKGSDMKITKLQLKGNVHNTPSRVITSSYSWPLGTTLEEIGRLIDGFSRAFDNTIADIFIIPKPAVDFIRINTDVIRP